MLSDHLFEGVLPLSRSSGSNILASSESIAIESLVQMREGVIHEAGGSFTNEGGSFVEGILRDTKPVSDQTAEVGLHFSTDSSDTDEDDVSLKWSLQRRMVPTTAKGEQKFTEETPKMRPFTREISQKLIGDAMKSSETTTTENRRTKRSGDLSIDFPTYDVVDVSIKVSENESVDEDTPLVVKKGKGKQVKKPSKVKSRTSTIKKADTTKGKENDPKRRGNHQKGREKLPLFSSNLRKGTRYYTK
ncbi:hypothetical protein KY290_010872 [Solanum tuberosum]|uniref:Uncharacterized protein n=1 Tax=Solanum tuberosum TaxID=4113 RepID=A0ABQ7VZI2_SOLTU|nr:hypothetical protein KY290_010872 [Solanum tuberosum]